MFVSNAVDRGFEARSGQTKYYNIYCGCFLCTHTELREKSKYWLAQSQDNIGWLRVKIILVG